jgi:3-dehydroquinate synthase
MVISDIKTLSTLSDEEFRSGLAEVVKYGMIAGPRLFSQLEKKSASILRRDDKILSKAVTTCSAIKARVVEEDEKDHGKRLILNFGHTLGHALEAASGFTLYRHGEAVAIGMLFAAKVSVKLGLVKEKDMHRLSGVLSCFGLPVQIKERMDGKVLLKFMRADKKSKDGKIRLVLPARIGTVVVSDKVGPELVLSTLEEMIR